MSSSTTLPRKFIRFTGALGGRLRQAWVDAADEAAAVAVAFGDADANKTRVAVAVAVATATGGASSSSEDFDARAWTRTPPRELPPNVVHHAPSPSFRKWAYLIAEENGTGSGSGASAGDKKLRVEIWDALLGPVKSVRVDAVHGPFVAGTHVGGLAWHDGEELLAYVAERKRPTPPETIPKPTDVVSTSDFDLPEDWGETFVGVRDPTVVLFSCVSGRAVALAGSTTPLRTEGQPCFAPPVAGQPTTRLALTSWTPGPDFRLGLVYCYNRVSEVRVLDISDVASALARPVGGGGDGNPTEEDAALRRLATAASDDAVVVSPAIATQSSSRSPRWSPDGSRVVFLSAPPSVAHNGPVQLSEWVVGTQKTRVVVDFASGVVRPAAFPSLYVDQLPLSCFSPDSQAVWCSTVWGSRKLAVRIELATGRVVPVEAANLVPRSSGAAVASSPEAGHAPKKPRSSNSNDVDDDPAPSYHVLAASRKTDRVLALRSSPNDPGRVVWLTAPAASSSSTSSSSSPTHPVMVLGGTAASRVSQAMYRVLTHTTTRTPGGDEGWFESILISPTPSLPDVSALIVMPHGGPHSAHTTEFLPDFSFIASELNAALLLVNYRGSTGLSPASLASLLGRIGDQDVLDVRDATTDALKTHLPHLPRSKVGVSGGSHGGFLSAHLTGQFPQDYAACAMRNPVIDLTAMAATSDIPDWTFAEATGKDATNAARVAGESDSETLAALVRCSPIRFASQATCPTLIHLGLVDRRVPPHQGVAWGRALSSRGVRVRVMRFPEDSHALDKVKTNEVVVETIVEWFAEALGVPRCSSSSFE